VDAGDIAQATSVTAIYEVRQRASDAAQIDPLRMARRAELAAQRRDAVREARYKAPGADTSKLLTYSRNRPNRVASIDKAPEMGALATAVAGSAKLRRGGEALGHQASAGRYPRTWVWKPGQRMNSAIARIQSN